MKTHPLAPIAKLNQYLPPGLGNSQSIAVLLSLAFHGVLFAAAPSFSSLQQATAQDDGSNPLARQVPMVELSPEEQNRLPDFNSFAYSLLPHQENPLKPFPGLSDLPPTPPSSGKSLNSLALPKDPLGTSSLGISPLPSGLGRSLFFPIPPLLPRRASPNNRPTDADRAIAAELARRSQQNPPSSMPTPPSSNNPMASAIAGTKPLNSKPEGPTDRLTDLRARLQYSPEQTTDAEVNNASQTWLRSVQETLGETPLAAAPAPLTVEIPYGLRICLTPPPAPGLVGLIRLPGEKSDSPEVSVTMLKSTGYPFLNTTALEAVKTQAGAADPPLTIGTLYQVVVNVNYDSKSCVKAETLLKSRTPNPSPSPTSPNPEGSPATP